MAPDSTLTFEEGEPITVGAHGEHDYVFEEGVEVTDSGVSTLVFESGTGLGEEEVIIDDWERGNISPYTIGPSTGDENFNASTNTVFEGTYALNSFDANNAGIVSLPGDGLNYYPVRGDLIEVYFYLNNDFEAAEFGVASQNYPGSSSNGENHYEFAVKANGSIANPPGGIHMGKRKNGEWDNGVIVDGDPAPLRSGPDAPTGEWIRGEIQWGDPTLTWTVYTQDGNGEFTNEFGSLSFDDTEWDSGGVHWSSSQSSGTGTTNTYSDYARKIGTV